MENTTTWVIDPAHSEIAFRVKHLMIASVRGNFKQFEGNVVARGDNFEAADIAFSMQTNSIDTQSPDRDAHLRSADFFDSDNFAVATFRSSSFTKVDEAEYEVTGELTIKGVSNTVVLTAEFGGVMTDPWGNEKAGFSVSGKLNRKDFGLNWNAALEAGGVLVGDEVKLQMDVELLKVKN